MYLVQLETFIIRKHHSENGIALDKNEHVNKEKKKYRNKCYRAITSTAHTKKTVS